MTISDALRDIIACPKCKAPLTFQDKAEQFICAHCHLSYRIQNGILDLTES